MTQEAIEKKRAREKALVGRMIALYCRKKHGQGALCDECAALQAYAHRRTELCPRMAQKTFCLHCPHPCYCEDMRVKIREVMRFSGPRMLYLRPLDALRHSAYAIKQRRGQGRR